MSDGPANDRPRSDGEFLTTHWSLVVSAGRRDDSAAADALAELCERYWYPLYAYIRRRSPDAHTAQDLTQAFFARLLEQNLPAVAAPERGKFRAFLLTAVKHFLANERDRAAAQKRGGAARRLSLAFDDGESRWSREPAHDDTPERLFDRQWAVTLLDGVLVELRDECAAAGRARQFELLKSALAGERDRLPYADLAASLELTEEAVRQAATRLRRRYRELLRAAITRTVAGPDEVDDEIRSLFAVLSDT
jgi:RNA polymerase sigma-70 factor (ECF subfamily)